MRTKEEKRKYYQEYRNRPEVKAHRKEYNKSYNQRIEVKMSKENYAKIPKNKIHHLNHHREYNKKPEVIQHYKKYKLKKRYNLTESEFNNLLKKSNNHCSICKKEIQGIQICIDHNHKTGKVRGILCRQCNAGLGFLKDDILILNSAIGYLKGVI